MTPTSESLGSLRAEFEGETYMCAVATNGTEDFPSMEYAEWLEKLLLSARAEVEEAKKQNAKLDAENEEQANGLANLNSSLSQAEGVIRHVNEYWNGLDNPRALGDALTHIVEVTDAFLSSHSKNQEKP